MIKAKVMLDLIRLNFALTSKDIVLPSSKCVVRELFFFFFFFSLTCSSILSPHLVKNISEAEAAQDRGKMIPFLPDDSWQGKDAKICFH